MVYSAVKGRMSSSAALDGSAELSPFASLVAGALAGMASWFVAMPADTLKTCFQTSTSKCYRHTAQAILARGGIAAFFTGLPAIGLGALPRDAACFTGTEAAQRALTLLADWRTRRDPAVQGVVFLGDQ